MDKEPLTDDSLLRDADGRLSAEGIRVVDISCVRTKHGKRVNASILRKPAVSHDDCAAATRAIKESLAAFGEDPDGFTYSVSSPGLTRVLRSEREYELFIGAPVRVFFTPEGETSLGCTELAGTIEGYANGAAAIVTADGRTVSVAGAMIRSMKLNYDI